MSYTKGSDVNLGVAQEATRGTHSTPTDWVPARTPTGITVQQEKYLVEETNAAGVDTSASEIVQKSAGGDLEFNVRNGTLGHFLKSLLGKVTTTSVETGVYKHVFTVDPKAQKPVLSLALAQEGGAQHYAYTTAGVNSLELRTPINELVNATAQFMAVKEAEHADFTPAFASTDYYFRHSGVVIKLASGVSGLDSADAISLKEFSNTIEGNVSKNQNIGSVYPNDVLAGRLALSGSFTADYTDKTHHDSFEQGTYQALRIDMTRDDVTLGTSSNPKLTIDYPRVSFESYESDRPLDDILKDNVEFKAHYDASEAKAIEVTLINEVSSY